MGEEEDISQTIPLIYGQLLPFNFTKRKISHVNGAHQKVSKIKDHLRDTLPIIIDVPILKLFTSSVV